MGSFYTATQRHNSSTIGKLFIRRVKICNFSRIGRKIEEEEHSKVQKMTLRDEVHSHCIVDRSRQVRTGLDKSEEV